MSGSTELWALFTAETGSAAQRLALYRISAFAAEDTGASKLDLDDLGRFLGEDEATVREALNQLVIKGYLAQVRPDETNPRKFTCLVQFNLDSEYKF